MKRKNSARIRALKTLCLSLTCLTAVPMLAAPAAAQNASAQKAYDFDIGAQSLSSALTAFAAETGLQIVYSQDDAGRISSPGAKGRMTADAALGRITAGTGYSFQYLRPGVVTLVKIPAGNGTDGELVTGVVSIEASQGSPYFGGAGRDAGVNGINGSRDITATEGTGSFTSGALTIGSKVPQALKDVPQSISVLTSERMEQQNVTDFTTAMKQLPGVTLVQGNSSLENAFYSRGYVVNSFQIDGGPPLIGSGFQLGGFFPQIDMAQYDHVELLRGAGTFNGYGDPSGTVNLVRKKPLDHTQFSIEAQAGSWNTYRVVADASSPLALDGKLRGRLVMSYQDNDYFYDRAKDSKTLVYGIAELDVTPTTLATAGISYQRQDSLPWYGGLPRYQNGDDLGLPRSLCLCFNWNRWDFETTQIFGGLEQRIGSEWTAKLNVTHSDQNSVRKVGYGAGAINPNTLSGTKLAAWYTEYGNSQLTTEASLAGAFEIFGQRQEVTLGLSRAHLSTAGQYQYGNFFVAALPIDVFDFNPSDPAYIEPGSSIPSSYTRAAGQTQWVGYANFRFTAFDRLHLTTGLRWSQYSYVYDTDGMCSYIPATDPGYTPSCFGLEIGDVYEQRHTKYKATDFSWPPAISLSYDITKSLTAYIGYTDIYLSQAGNLGNDLKPIGPITGGNYEGGLKYAANNGRLNLSLSAYRIAQKGFRKQVGTYDFNVTAEEMAAGIYYYIVSSDGQRFPNAMVDAGGRNCCWISDPNRTQISQGIDLDMSGELVPGWQVAASYTYNDNKLDGSFFGDNEGKPFITITPKHLYKLWMSYDFAAAGKAGWVSGLTISGGVNGQSSAFRSGYACPTEYVPPYPEYPDYLQCDGGEQPYQFTVSPYAVFSGRIDYRFSDTWSLAVNLENILDKTYFQAVGDVNQDNWYGTPRSVTATLRAKW